MQGGFLLSKVNFVGFFLKNRKNYFQTVDKRGEKGYNNRK